jgi:NADP-dependent 3-hydroxy acid dehydrogenase YdfG
VGTSNIVGKVVVITGASSGIGESTARLLSGNGAKVVLGARRKDRIGTLVKNITAEGGSALGFETDVTKRGDVEALVEGQPTSPAKPMSSLTIPGSCPLRSPRLRSTNGSG